MAQLQPITLFVDDQDRQVKYLCPSLNQVVTGSYYNNTWTTVKSESCNQGWFEYTFYGTGVHVSASLANAGESYQVKIDDGSFVPQSGDGSYDSPTLPDGEHTITYATGSAKAFPSFDYLTVTAGASTPLNGRTIAVDDADKAIVYSGGWTTTPPVPIAFDYSTSLYRDTTHWASTVGDSMRFQFIGTSISVFGIVANFQSGGNISATYTIDGVEKTQAIPKGTLDTLPMVELFHADLQAGSHTLVVNITDIATPRAFGLDFVAYNSSLNSISAMPGYGGAVSSASTGPGENKTNWGPKIGIIVGVVSLMTLLTAGAIIWWQRRRNRKAGIPRLSDSTESLEAGTKR
ncbi:hypothetical protein B0H34DRAFT_789156 [Crassisporium funariophilum]|nr:hypothetical protein B0H34DRAFT_789156 [Crassisporium funariophilum]